MSAVTTQRFIGKRNLAQLLGVSVRTIENMRNRGALLDPVPMGVSHLKWDAEEVEAWITAGFPSRERWEEIRGE